MSAPDDDAGGEIVTEEVSRRTMLRGLGGLAAGAASASVSQTAWATPLSGVPANAAREMLMTQTGVDALVGTWRYRSFRNNPTFRFEDCRQCSDLAVLFFGQGDLVIDDFAPGDFSGRLIFGPGSEMALVGASSFGNPFTIRFQGRGVTEGIKDFVYDYVGYLVPVWPNGVAQRPAIVGSIVRTEPHSGGAEPGEVASWIAVKQG
jgi:hypothetical protein